MEIISRKIIRLAGKLYMESAETQSNIICVSTLPFQISEHWHQRREKKKFWRMMRKICVGHWTNFITTLTATVSKLPIHLCWKKYCDAEGKLLENYPSYYQFRYFFRKTKNQQKFYISREGLAVYQRDYRPLLGEGVREYAPCIGIAMLDSTVCDIYLVNEANQIVGTVWN